MKTNIFHSASVKLSATYLTIIMIISLLFSVGLYRVSAQEVQRGIRAQSPFGASIRGRPDTIVLQLLTEQEERIAEAKERIRNDLVLINILILFSGGLGSYYLAKKTLEPIEQAHDAQSRFTADASHELRTPITAMRVETELTLTEDNLTLKKAKEQLKSNIEELDKLTALSEGLLQLARLDNNDLEKEPTPLAHITQQAIERVQKKAEQKKLTIQQPKPADIEVVVNQQAIVEALAVLLDNAVKYTPNNSTVTVKTAQTKQSVAISVVDTGVGIRASEVPHIFERFYRADSSRTKHDSAAGYGIGLSIAKAIVDLHGGDISVSSTQDKGSTFTISLPV